MNLIKSRKTILNAVVLYLFLMLHAPKISATIGGPKFIIPGQSNGYGVTHDPPIFNCVEWTCSSESATLEDSDDNCSVTVTVSKEETACTITLTAKYFVVIAGHPGEYNEVDESIEITVLPWIEVPDCIQPLQTASVWLHDNCNGTPSNSCTYSYNWSADFCVNCPNTMQPNIQVQLPNNPAILPAAITINCIIDCPNLFNPNISVALTTTTLQVCLPTPEVSGGPFCIGCIGCPSLSSFVLTVNNPIPGTGWWYEWSVQENQTPASMQIVSGQGTPQITLNPINPGSCNVTVKVQTSQLNPTVVSDASDPIPIQVCCMPQITVANNVTIVDLQQAGLEIVTTSTVNSGAQAEYHAGFDVDLKPGFEAFSGSHFHGYILECTGSYTPRQSNSATKDSSRNNQISPSIAGPQKSGAQRPTQYIQDNGNSSFSNKISVIPNPSNGSCDIKLPSGLKFAEYYLTIEEISGGEIYSEKGNAKFDKIKLDLHDVKSGMYLIKFNCNNKLYYEKMVITK